MPDPVSGAASMSSSAAPSEDALAAIRDILDRVRFGSIALTIHDGKIVQMDVTEKRRLAT